MKDNIAIMGIILKNRENVEVLNKLLSEYGDYIIGRMGIPYKAKSLNVISIVLDAPKSIIDELNDKIKELDGIVVSTACSDI